MSTFEPGRSTLLKRNGNYYGEAPSLERIELLSIPDSTARVNALDRARSTSSVVSPRLRRRRWTV
ncbi:hypothetical protein, partial [Micromonospora sp. b486]|uniref:hypothetical protein n=1 Tax=Micromonospora sp. b486 TaxID=3053986 RepID=UPI00259CE0BD